MAAISSKYESTLMKSADYKLLITEAPEACSIGMAPTTSTTLTLAVGDALAVALMENRNFKPEDFKVFHPGGRLGAQMVTVSQLMHTENSLPTVDKDLTMPEVLITMTSKGFGIAVVMENDKLFGVITDGDLRRHMDHLLNVNAGEIAEKNPVTVAPNMLAATALNIMNANQISVLLAVEKKNRPVGILHIHDLLRAGIV